MRVKRYSWPLTLAILCSYSAIEAPFVYLYDLQNELFFTASNLIVSFLLMLLSAFAWRKLYMHQVKKKAISEIVLLSILAFSSLPFGLIGAKWLVIFKLLRFAGLLKAYQDLQFTHHGMARPKKVLLIVVGAITGVHLVASTWMMIQPKLTGTPTDRYIEAFYWAVTTLTTTGFGDITPTNNIGRLFAVFVMFVGFSAFGVIVGNVSNLLLTKNRHQEANREKIEDLAIFMQYYDVPKNLRSEVFGYHSHRRQKRLSDNDSNIIADLPHGLQHELNIYIKIKLIDGLPVFHGVSHACLKKVAQHLSPHSFAAGASIIKIGENGEQMYIIDQGEVEVFTAAGNMVALIQHGQCVGEMALLTQALRTADVKAKTYCDVYCLSKIDFDLISKEYPELEEHFRMIMNRRSMDKNKKAA